MTSRIVTVGLVCASLYAAALGAGAVAQDEASTPTPTVAAETATPQAPEATTTSTPTPFASPVETVVEPTPEATQTATPQADPTAAPTTAPKQAPAQTPAQAPAQSATPDSSPTATATPELGVDKTRRARKRSRPNRAQGNSEVCPENAERVGTLVDPSGSTSARECVVDKKKDRKRDKDRDEDGGDDHDHGTTDTPAPTHRSDGTPTPANPGYSLATPGPAPIGVPNFFIEKFRIPPFLLPIYQAAGIQYGVRWEILAAINEIETDYGRNLNISSAGALGWMQFMPATWAAYGVDANGDGEKDPFNPVDAIFAAARYLRAAGADTDLYRAIFAYNHADWYVESVLMRARVIGGLPADLVGSLTGLTQGRFPVAAKSTYAGALSNAEREQRFEPGENAARPVESDGTRRAIRIFSRKRAPVVAVQDGRITRMGHTRRLGNFVELQDSYGNTYLYSGLGEVAETYPFPKERKAKRRELALPEGDPAPRRAASATKRASKPGRSRTIKPAKRGSRSRGGAAAKARPGKQRLRASGAALPGGAAVEGAPVRAPAAPARTGRRRRRAARGRRAGRADARRPPPRPARVRGQAAQEGRARQRRHGARPGRQERLQPGSARPLRDPPGRPRRPADRPEADPRRLEAARVDRDLPLGQAQPVLRRRRRAPLDRPDHADEQAGAPAQGAAQPAHRRSTSAAATTSRPARSTGACSRRSSSSPRRA